MGGTLEGENNEEAEGIESSQRSQKKYAERIENV
jgi:hypothetical protein